jgi:hypothetical protein
MAWVRHIGIVRSGLLAAALLLLLLACAGKEPVKPSVDQRARVRSEVRILSIDDVEYSEPMWNASLEPGPHLLIVRYPTVVANYRCTFEIEVEAGQSYEIIERPDRFPVFFNLMEEGILFSLLSRRVDRFPPRDCIKI